MEQLFSYLSRFNNTTKSMNASGMFASAVLYIYLYHITLFEYPCAFYTPRIMSTVLTTGREEHITEAVLFWNQQKLRRLPFLLQTRLQEVK